MAHRAEGVGVRGVFGSLVAMEGAAVLPGGRWAWATTTLFCPSVGAHGGHNLLGKPAHGAQHLLLR